MPRVLVVDDLPENVYLLKVMLESFGYAVETAENGAQALEKARAQPPEVVIADILMPVMDGFTLCREWRQDKALWQVPFVFYTATYTDEKDEKFALSLGADRFISKPAEPDVIVQAVQELLASGRSTTMPDNGMAPETVYLREYNEALVRKLEDKCRDMEKANERLRAIDGIKDHLLANVSHELRTPLVAIRGYAEMIRSGQSGPVAERQAEQCGIMLRNVDRLLAMIDNLLFFARGSHADEPLKREMVDAGALLDEVVALLAGKAREGKLSLHAEPAPAISVTADRRRLLQALLTVADNAVKFTPPGGSVTLSAVAEKGAVRFIIRDSGRGLKPGHEQLIFERFYQADMTTTREHGGLGIGLSIAKEIIEQHGGSASAQNIAGSGCIFTLTLPAVAT